MCSCSCDTSDLCSGPAAPHAVCDEMPLPSRDDVDRRTLLPPRGTTVIVSVVPDGGCMPMAVHQRRCLLDGRMRPKALETFPK
jgi:hypothetical protein